MPHLRAVAEINKAHANAHELLSQVNEDLIVTDTLREIIAHLDSARDILIHEVVDSYLVIFHTGQVTQFRHVETRQEAKALKQKWDERNDYCATILSIKSRGNAQIGL